MRKPLFIIVFLVLCSMLIFPPLQKHYLLRQDDYVKNRILEELNSEFTDINFSYVYLDEVIHLDTAQIPRHSWYAAQSSSKYLRLYIVADGEFDIYNLDTEGINCIKGFIDLNGNVFHQGLNIW